MVTYRTDCSVRGHGAVGCLGDLEGPVVSDTFLMSVRGLFSVKEHSVEVVDGMGNVIRSTDRTRRPKRMDTIEDEFWWLGQEVWERWGDAARWPEPMIEDDLDSDYHHWEEPMENEGF